MSRSSDERLVQLLCAVYKTIQQGDVPVPSMLQAMLERVLLPLASYCSPKALAELFSANVSDILAALLARFTKVCWLLSCYLYLIFCSVLPWWNFNVKCRELWLLWNLQGSLL